MATRMVLCHSSHGYQMGGSPRLSLVSPSTTSVMDQQGARLGASKGCAHTAEPHPRSPRKRYWSGHSNASNVTSSNTALQPSSPPSVGIQSGGTASYSALPRHDARGDVQIVLRT